ncbi:MAG TPA: DinB family protein [Chitinophagaceae bacterium]|nr:DinB family protein [Chitinophagaceae bacterium]
MNKETQYIIKTFESTLSGQPWFGRAVYEMLEEANESKVNTKPNGTEHSMLELIWHMNTWAEFALGAIEYRTIEDMKKIEANDWRAIDPEVHTWKKGIDQLRATHNKIIELLKQKGSDAYLKDIVTNRQYNFRFLLNGLIQHNIYHLGQIAYVNKLLS